VTRLLEDKGTARGARLAEAIRTRHDESRGGAR
jgi:hypothetical protein